jgi:hypothetical protein
MLILELHFDYIISMFKLINILNPLSSSSRQSEERKYRIETEKDVCYL